jgi:hypothetical protein
MTTALEGGGLVSAFVAPYMRLRVYTQVARTSRNRGASAFHGRAKLATWQGTVLL